MSSQGMFKNLGKAFSKKPDDYIEKYGADALRTYLMFLGPFNQGGDFRDTGIEGMSKFMERLWKLFNAKVAKTPPDTTKKITNKMHQTIKKVSNDLANFRYNTAISAVFEYSNELKSFIEEEKSVPRQYLIALAQLIAPFAPHIAQESSVSIYMRSFGASSCNA